MSLKQLNDMTEQELEQAIEQLEFVCDASKTSEFKINGHIKQIVFAIRRQYAGQKTPHIAITHFTDARPTHSDSGNLKLPESSAQHPMSFFHPFLQFPSYWVSSVLDRYADGLDRMGGRNSHANRGTGQLVAVTKIDTERLKNTYKKLVYTDRQFEAAPLAETITESISDDIFEKIMFEFGNEFQKELITLYKKTLSRQKN